MACVANRLFKHMFSALRCVFEALMLVGSSKVSYSKMQCNAVNACINSMWQLVLRDKAPPLTTATTTYQQDFCLTLKASEFFFPLKK